MAPVSLFQGNSSRDGHEPLSQQSGPPTQARSAGDAAGAVAAHLAGVGVEDVDAVDLDLDLVAAGGEDGDVRLAEDDEEVPLPRVLQVGGHAEVAVHPGLEHWNAAKAVEVGRVGVVVRGAGHEHIEAGIGGLLGGGDKVGAGHGPELRSDEDGGAPLGAGVRVTLGVAPLGADQLARPRFSRIIQTKVLLPSKATGHHSDVEPTRPDQDVGICHFRSNLV